MAGSMLALEGSSSGCMGCGGGMNGMAPSTFCCRTHSAVPGPKEEGYAGSSALSVVE
jgi:hypothetical protein